MFLATNAIPTIRGDSSDQVWEEQLIDDEWSAFVAD